MRNSRKIPILCVVSIPHSNMIPNEDPAHIKKIFQDDLPIKPIINALPRVKPAGMEFAPAGKNAVDHRTLELEQIQEELTGINAGLFIPLQPDTGRISVLNSYTESETVTCTHLFPLSSKTAIPLVGFRFVRKEKGEECSLKECTIRGFILGRGKWQPPNKIIRLLHRCSFTCETMVLFFDIVSREEFFFMKTWFQQLRVTKTKRKLINAELNDFHSTKIPLPENPFVLERSRPGAFFSTYNTLDFSTPYEPVASMRGEISLDAGCVYRFKAGALFPPGIPVQHESKIAEESSKITTSGGTLTGKTDSSISIEGDSLRGLYLLKTFSGPNVLLPGHLKVDFLSLDNHDGLISRWEIRHPEMSGNTAEIHSASFLEIPLLYFPREKKIHISGYYPDGTSYRFKVCGHNFSEDKTVELFGSKICFESRSERFIVGIHTGDSGPPALPIRLMCLRKHFYLMINPGGTYRHTGRIAGGSINRFVLTLSQNSEITVDPRLLIQKTRSRGTV